MRSRLAAAAEARGDPDSLRLATAVRAHRVGDLRKSQMLALCREWRYRSDLWVPRGYRRRPPVQPPAAAAAAAVSGSSQQPQQRVATGTGAQQEAQQQLVLAPPARAGGLFSYPQSAYQPAATATPSNSGFHDHAFPRVSADPARLSLVCVVEPLAFLQFSSRLLANAAVRHILSFSRT